MLFLHAPLISRPGAHVPGEVSGTSPGVGDRGTGGRRGVARPTRRLAAQSPWWLSFEPWPQHGAAAASCSPRSARAMMNKPTSGMRWGVSTDPTSAQAAVPLGPRSRTSIPPTTDSSSATEKSSPGKPGVVRRATTHGPAFRSARIRSSPETPDTAPRVGSKGPTPDVINVHIGQIGSLNLPIVRTHLGRLTSGIWGC